MLLYVRLLDRVNKPASPQNHLQCSDEQPQRSHQKNLTAKAHQDTVEHLRQVESNHALERRLFY